MTEKHACIICNKPIGSKGFVGTIKDMSVSFCEEHADGCKERCDSCVQAEDCPICGKLRY